MYVYAPHTNISNRVGGSGRERGRKNRTVNLSISIEQRQVQGRIDSLSLSLSSRRARFRHPQVTPNSLVVHPPPPPPPLNHAFSTPSESNGFYWNSLANSLHTNAKLPRTPDQTQLFAYVHHRTTTRNEQRITLQWLVLPGHPTSSTIICSFEQRRFSLAPSTLFHLPPTLFISTLYFLGFLLFYLYFTCKPLNFLIAGLFFFVCRLHQPCRKNAG